MTQSQHSNEPPVSSMARPRKTWLRRAGQVGLLATLLSGCAARTKQEWLAVFFDGVSRPKAVGAPGTAVNSTAVTVAVLAATAKPVDSVSVHAPFAKGQCQYCHESKFSQRLITDPSVLCTTCHKELMGHAQYEHAPAAMGDCLVCHDPHQSPQPALLRIAANGLCAQCHAPVELSTAKEHQNMGTATCMTCHNPHQGDKYFLKPGSTTTPLGPPLPPGL